MHLFHCYTYSTNIFLGSASKLHHDPMDIYASLHRSRSELLDTSYHWMETPYSMVGSLSTRWRAGQAQNGSDSGQRSCSNEMTLISVREKKRVLWAGNQSRGFIPLVIDTPRFPSSRPYLHRGLSLLNSRDCYPHVQRET